MGEFVLLATKVEEISHLNALAGAPVRVINRCIRSLLLAASNSLVPSFGWKSPVRRFIDEVRARLYGYHGLPYVRKIHGTFLLCTPLSDAQGREVIAAANFDNVFRLPDVFAVGARQWIEVYWYHDGGSDGFDELQQHEGNVSRYFAEQLRAVG